MSEPYDNTNSGALFKNDRKEKQNQPDHKGEVCVRCPHCGQSSNFWLAAWIKEARTSGKRFFSLALTEKDEPQAPTKRANDPVGKNRTQYGQSKERSKSKSSASAPNAGFDDSFDDDIPF